MVSSFQDFFFREEIFYNHNRFRVLFPETTHRKQDYLHILFLESSQNLHPQQNKNNFNEIDKRTKLKAFIFKNP